MNFMIVDGYNIIGAWPDLRKLKEENLAAARDLLIERMADYQGYTGYKVIVVFDAHYVKGTEKKYRNYKVEVIFTRENESADERIEKMAIELTTIKNQVYVATSDYTEQWQVFGQGALRVSARELLTEIEIVEQKIKRNINKIKEEKFHSKISLNDEVAEIFEKWRRGDQ